MRIVGNPPSGGKKPTTPTIGTATDGGTGTTVSVAFTPSTYIGKGTITYTATSNPGSLTASGSGSPLTVSGLTTGTAYTFTVQGATNYGVNSDASAASNSVTPASPTSFDSIATSTPTSGQTITFSSIPSTYKHLQLRMSVVASAQFNLYMQYNGDGGTNNYRYHYLVGGTNTGTVQNFSAGQGLNTQIGLNGWAWSGVNQTYPTALIIDILDYANTSKYKVSRNFVGINKNQTVSGGGNANSEISLSSSWWNNTAAINSITILLSGSSAFGAGTSIALYGIKG